MQQVLIKLILKINVLLFFFGEIKKNNTITRKMVLRVISDYKNRKSVRASEKHYHMIQE